MVEIKQRTPRERAVYFDGMIAAYDFVMKAWPVRKDEIKGFIAVAKIFSDEAKEESNSIESSSS